MLTQCCPKPPVAATGNSPAGCGEFYFFESTKESLGAKKAVKVGNAKQVRKKIKLVRNT
jgi:hypothetical protein